MDIEFKSYTDNYKPELLEMMKTFNEIDGYAFNLAVREKNLVEFTSNEQLGRLYLIKSGTSTIGYIVLTFGYSFEYLGRDAFIDELYITENFRHKGIGKLTMNFIESESKKLNVKAIHLEVEPHNTNANRLYLSKGYQSNDRSLLTKSIKTTTNNDHQ